MAHQTHALPWNTLASHFKHTISHQSHPQRIDIHPQKKSTQANDISFFCKTLAKQIHDFSESERGKYQPAEYYRKRASTWVNSEERASEMRTGKSGKDVETRKVIPSKLQQCAPYTRSVSWDQYRSGSDVEAWILSSSDAGYGSWIGGGEILKILIMEAASTPPALSADAGDDALRREAMETLLLMAHHPRMEILRLRHMHWGHHFGVSRVAEEAVKAYVYVNLVVAMVDAGSDVCDFIDVREGKRRKYMECKSYQTLLGQVAGSYDGDTQTLVHRLFFLGDSGESFSVWRDVPNRGIFEDMQSVREYLKGVWRVMVTYDVIVREAGGDPTWQQECEDVLSSLFGVRHEADN